MEENCAQNHQTEDKGDSERRKSELVYGIEDNPPIPQLLVLGLQQFLSMAGAQVTIPLILAQILCMRHDVIAVSYVISATFLMQGVTTLLQSTFGCRLPIIQGSSFSFIPPSIALMSFYGGCSYTKQDNFNATDSQGEEIWQSRLAEVNGGILLASLIQVLLGLTGFISFMLRFVGPLSVAPVLMLLGISLSQVAWQSCQAHWGVSVFTAGMIILFTQFLSKKKIPMVGFSREKGFHVSRTRFLLKYSMILAASLGWFLCWILTVAGALSDDPSERTYWARTDIASEVFINTSWISVPYPGQIVWPAPSVAAFFGMLSAVIASIIESIGDYNACARMCEIPSPPKHALNRGIMMEGLGGLLSSIWGTGTGTASYSVNIVIIGITKVASRRVIQTAAVMIIVMAFFQALCSFFATMPDPVIGGKMIATVGMLISVGVSLLQKVDITSSRNMFVLGISLFLGIVMPEYMQNNPDIIQTGLSTFDKCATILLETGIFVGFVTGLVFDNLVPGTLMERGLLRNQQLTEAEEDSLDNSSDAPNHYDFPFGMGHIRRWGVCRFVPISPTFRGFPRLRQSSSHQFERVLGTMESQIS